MKPAEPHQWAAFYSAHLDRFRKLNDKQAQSKCPWHEDHNPSFSINLHTGQWSCHGCQITGGPIDFADKKGIRRETLPGWEPRSSMQTIESTYDYRDESGVLLFQAVRFQPKSFRQRKPDGNGGWTWELNGTRRVLYRLPEILAASKTEPTVFIVEGEKDAETLRGHGFQATCNPMGAGKWKDEYSETLKGYLEAVVIADKDEVGRKHALDVASSIKTRIDRVKIVELPGDSVKDATDWFNTGGDPIAFMNLVNQASLCLKEDKLGPSIEVPQKPPEIGWPNDLKQAAFHGLVGELVQTIIPHTEADPAAVLINLLAAFGNVIGPRPHFRANFDRHALNLNAMLVGETSKGRKGTSWGPIRTLMQRVDAEWAAKQITSGMSSGEGIIWATRDPIFESQPIKENQRVVDYQQVQIDPGVVDKRLLIIEGEFGRSLKAMAREGNTLSAVIRSAWDSGDLQTMTKNSPAKATGAHISVIGHITKDELRRHLSGTDTVNGFANRFLWVMARRSQCLPEGGCMSEADIEKLSAKLSEAVRYSKFVLEIRRTDEARRLWAEIYPELSEGRAGIVGSATNRAEAYVMRLACIYALLDQASFVEVAHLRAALAVWDRVEQSAAYIFAGATCNPTAERIIQAVRTKGSLTMTAVSELFNRNLSKGEIDTAIEQVEALGIARRTQVETLGRPAVVLEVTGGKETNEITKNTPNLVPSYAELRS